MKTIIYISRHSEPFTQIVKENMNETLQINNEKQILNVIGEKKAKKLSELDELSNIDVVISSNYARAIATAKYISDKNNLSVIVDEDFGERRFGIDDWNEIDDDFYEKQYNDENFKVKNGESAKEVKERMYGALLKVLKKYMGKKVVIVSHATAMCFLFSTWCQLNLIDTKSKTRTLYFKNKLVFSGNYDAPELFKLEFEDKNLINIENIKIDY